MKVIALLTVNRFLDKKENSVMNVLNKRRHSWPLLYKEQQSPSPKILLRYYWKHIALVNISREEFLWTCWNVRTSRMGQKPKQSKVLHHNCKTKNRCSKQGFFKIDRIYWMRLHPKAFSAILWLTMNYLMISLSSIKKMFSLTCFGTCQIANLRLKSTTAFQ